MGFQLKLVALYRAMETLEDDRARETLSEMEAILQTPEFNEAYGKELMELCSASAPTKAESASFLPSPVE